jgi:hypothetical protein
MNHISLSSTPITTPSPGLVTENSLDELRKLYSGGESIRIVKLDE